MNSQSLTVIISSKGKIHFSLIIVIQTFYLRDQKYGPTTTQLVNLEENITFGVGEESNYPRAKIFWIKEIDDIFSFIYAYKMYIMEADRNDCTIFFK